MARRVNRLSGTIEELLHAGVTLDEHSPPLNHHDGVGEVEFVRGEHLVDYGIELTLSWVFAPGPLGVRPLDARGLRRERGHDEGKVAVVHGSAL